MNAKNLAKRVLQFRVFAFIARLTLSILNGIAMQSSLQSLIQSPIAIVATSIPSEIPIESLEIGVLCPNFPGVDASACGN